MIPSVKNWLRPATFQSITAAGPGRPDPSADALASAQPRARRKAWMVPAVDTGPAAGPAWTEPPTAPRAVIAVPVFNKADYLESALDSLLSQSYENFALVVV